MAARPPTFTTSHMNDPTRPAPRPDLVVHLRWYHQGQDHHQGSDEFTAIAEPFATDGITVRDDGSSRYPVGRGAGGPGIDAGSLIMVIAGLTTILAAGPTAIKNASRPIRALASLLRSRRRQIGRLPSLLLSVDLDNIPVYQTRPQSGRHLLTAFPPTDQPEEMDETIAAVESLSPALLTLVSVLPRRSRGMTTLPLLWNHDEQRWYLKVAKATTFFLMLPRLRPLKAWQPKWNASERAWYIRLPYRSEPLDNPQPDSQGP